MRARWRSLGEDPASVLGATQNCAIAAFRGRRHDEARERFLDVLDDPSLDGSPARIEVLAALAWVAAAAGDRARTERQAAGCLAAEGELPADVRARVRRSIAEAWLTLGDRERARAVLAPVAITGATSPPEDEFGVLVCRLVLGPNDPELLARAVVTAPSSSRGCVRSSARRATRRLRAAPPLAAWDGGVKATERPPPLCS